MTVSQLNKHRPENVIASNEAMGKLIELAKQNDFGIKNSYNFQQGVGEFARDFALQRKPFGSYNINGHTVCFVSEDHLSPEHKPLFGRIRSIRTEATGVYAIATGKIINMPSVREPLFVETVKRDYEEN